MKNRDAPRLSELMGIVYFQQLTLYFFAMGAKCLPSTHKKFLERVYLLKGSCPRGKIAFLFFFFWIPTLFFQWKSVDYPTVSIDPKPPVRLQANHRFKPSTIVQRWNHKCRSKKKSPELSVGCHLFYRKCILDKMTK